MEHGEQPIPVIEFGRAICGDLLAATRREWLISNGIGGYGMGTISGIPTRCYHGLLVAALQPPVGRTLLLAKLDETVTYAGQDFALFANHWASGVIEPHGHQHIERFHLEGTIPVWTFACADALLQKRIWMQQGANTTYVQYRLSRASAPLTLGIKALVTYRDHHHHTEAGSQQFEIDSVEGGVRVRAVGRATPFYLFAPGATIEPRHEWHHGYFWSIEDYRGQDTEESLLQAATLRIILQPGQSCTLVASTEARGHLDGGNALAARIAYEKGLLSQAVWASEAPPAVRHLLLAADQFIVSRPLAGDPAGRSVIAGYPWFSDWGRDTMIALPGLALVTGRYEIAHSILRTFAHFVDRGMVPNRFPDAGEAPEYNTADATLWYIEAVRAYVAATGDRDLLAELFPVLADIIAWHRRGTRYGIAVDEEDGLLRAGEPGVQLTWMDAKVGDWVVTPRIGKPVEINALWFNALQAMSGFAAAVGRGEEAATYAGLARQVRAGFARFWYEAGDYCFDVIDGPEGADAALRPNQLLAVSLAHSPLDPDRQKAMVDLCARHLLTSHGLRSLAPDHPAYAGHYGGDQHQRDAAYHQGTVWGWLIGPFAAAHLRVYQDRAQARAFLAPLLRHLDDHGLGSISEIFDGDPPFRPRGCIAQAWSVAEVLRLWRM